MLEDFQNAPRESLLRISWQRAERAVVVHAEGEVDLSTVAELESGLGAARDAATPPDHLVADLAAVGFFAACGASILLDYHYQCTRRDTPLHVVAGLPVARTLQLCHVDGVLTVFPALTGAVSRGRGAKRLRDAPDWPVDPLGSVE
ncbi:MULTISPECIES: STAS domain-containing protein [Prauserella]|uniref:STAS domain-containing protein n=1 Tax=Prauserella TaxID=142577 RepID=UPI000D830CB6|nr:MULTISPECIES: STAS domain-containing protein [Prauserella]PXY25208.1 hypothetical protein BAY59_24655 [Prauserella coralliicola]